MYAADNSINLRTVSQCLTYCSVNSSCLSVTFDPATSTCYTAGNTDVFPLENGDLGQPVYMKSSVLANVYHEQPGLSVGQYLLKSYFYPQGATVYQAVFFILVALQIVEFQ